MGQASMGVAPSPAPGWYADPSSATSVRWWDGRDWTEHTQPRPVEPLPAQPRSQPATEPGAEPEPGVGAEHEVPGSRRRVWPILLLIVFAVAAVLVELVMLGLLLKPSWHATAQASSGSGSSAGIVAPPCVETVEALTADGTTGTVVARLESTASGADLPGAAAFFAEVGEQSASVLTSTGAACAQAVAGGAAPATYAAFIDEFNRAIADGTTIVAAAISQKGVLTTVQVQQLQGDAATLAAAQAVVAPNAATAPAGPSGSSTPSVGKIG